MSEEINLVQIHATGDYGSEFESDSEADKERARRKDLAEKQKPKKHKVASKSEVTDEYNKEEGRKMRYHILSMDAYARHKKFINDYLLYFGGSREDFKRDSSRDKTDIDVIHENHRFLWTEEDTPNETWEKRMAKKYHDKLFKEYCITDLSRYKENKIAMRWRIEKEVIVGKGQFECGNKHCSNMEGMRSWEVNFGYIERGMKKNALIKLRLCPECSHKLNYHKRRKEVTKQKRKHRDVEAAVKKQKVQDASSSDTVPNTEGDGEPEASSSSSSAHKDGEASATSAASDRVWEGPAKTTEDKSREEEFEEYFEDMFM